jgi:SAM-dependent methyltransferase
VSRKAHPSDRILEAYDEALERHGDTAQGACWPNEEDRKRRFDVMLGLISPSSGERNTVCDLACGTGELLSHIRSLGRSDIDYVGVDRSAHALSLARAKHPGASFLELDVSDIKTDLSPMACDYLVCSGLFTMKFGLSDADMWEFFRSTLTRIWPFVRRGMAFNVMSKAVDWERDDLFHAAMDDVARLLHSLAGRNIVLRADYGLYEYTAYAWRRGG